MAKNKIVYGNTTLIDLTDATAVASDILSGKTAYGKEGTKLVGTAAGSSTIATATKAVGSSDANSLSFTVSGQPKAFALHSTSSINLSSSTRYIASIQTDGSNVYTNDVYRNGSTYATNYDATSSSFSYSNGTLTVNSSKYFRRNVTYRLIYVY